MRTPDNVVIKRVLFAIEIAVLIVILDGINCFFGNSCNFF